MSSQNVTRKALTTVLDDMLSRWFSGTFSFEKARKHISIISEERTGEELREAAVEYDSEFTPLMMFRTVPLFGGYERDYEVFLHNELRGNLQHELMFTGVALVYVSHMASISYEDVKWYVRDYVTGDDFNLLCDMIRSYYHSRFSL